MAKKPTYEELEQRVKELEKESIEGKQAERALRESEEKFQTVVNNVNDVIFQLSPLGFIQYVSPKVEDIYGYKPEELIGKHLKKTTPMSELPNALEALNRVLSGKILKNFEINQLDSRGKIVSMEISATPVKKEGKIIAAQGVMRDITDRKHTEKALQKAHAELEQRVEERTTELVVANRQLKREIEERKRAEEALRESERYLRLSNQINNIFLTYPDEKMYEEVLKVILKVMESKYGTFGYFDEQGAFVAPAVTRKIYWDKCNVPEKNIIFQKGTFGGIWGKSIKERKTLIDNDGPFNTPEGHIFIENTIVTPLIFHGEAISAIHLANKPNGYDEKDKEMLETIADQIAPVLYARLQRDKQDKERKQAEEAVARVEREWQNACDSMNDAMLVLDGNHRILRANKMAEKLFQRSFEEQTGKHCWEIVHGTTQPIPECPLPRVQETQERETLELPIGERQYELTVDPILDAAGQITGFIHIVSDITERKWAEEALRRSSEELLKEHDQRKALSKRLIDLLEKDRRQIAMELHDHIGQTLTSLKMNLEMIHGKLKPGHTELEAQITAAQERAVQSIRDVKRVSQGLRPTMIEALGLIPSLRELFNMIQQQTDIEIHFFSQRIPKQFEGEKELAIYRIAQEALNNIIRHAQAKNIFVNLIKKNKKLSLSVEDDGIGFNPDKVMKPSERKKSLGLLIMRERAVQLDGEFSIESQPGKGTHLLAEIPL